MGRLRCRHCVPRPNASSGSCRAATRRGSCELMAAGRRYLENRAVRGATGRTSGQGRPRSRASRSSAAAWRRLTEEARKNDDAWRRAQAREMELLEADTLDALLERLTSGAARELSARGRDARHRRSRSRDPPPVGAARAAHGAAGRRACSSIPCTASRRRSPPAVGRGSASSTAPTTRCCSRRPRRSKASPCCR